MPIDINLLRADKGGDPEMVRASEKARFRTGEIVDEVIALDETWRKEDYQLNHMRREVNEVQGQIKERKKSSKGQDACTELVEQKTALEAKVAEQEAVVDEAVKSRDKRLHKIGNLVHPSVTISQDEEKDNKITSQWGDYLLKRIPKGSFKKDGYRPHYQLLEMMGAVEFEAGQDVAGHRGYFLTDVGVLLNQALINFGLSFCRRQGCKPVQPPFMMRKDLMGLCAELADYDECLYKIVESPEHPQLDKYLIATSEQPMCAMYRGKTLEPKELPMRYCGVSSCFRKEAGSAGRDIRGIFRVHQFEKIEQFTFTTPEDSWDEHARMISNAEGFYQALQIPYRVVDIVSGELNDAAAKKYDLEAWFPADNDGEGKYRELVSCSNCLDYQARAVQTKCGFDTNNKGAPTKYCHMLNSTLCATERAMCCLVENYQEEKGVRVPRALLPYMDGVEFMPFVKPCPKEKK